MKSKDVMVAWSPVYSSVMGLLGLTHFANMGLTLASLHWYPLQYGSMVFGQPIKISETQP